ncbi:hypothetical protein ACGFZJ_24680 [Streptomyces sp. NPDC048253]|uniref:hypothetical protein n=1 Tax=Streptomyces sp. NPDC048253 TaxID=3365524 RepID=UPI0037103101
MHSGQARALDYIRRVRANASVAVAGTQVVESRQQTHEVLAALGDRIETTPWGGECGRNALRVLRAHLTFAEGSGGAGACVSSRPSGCSSATATVSHSRAPACSAVAPLASSPANRATPTTARSVTYPSAWA